MQVILIIGSVQALFFAVLLVNKRRRRLHDKILALWLGILGLHLAFAYWLFLKELTYLNFAGYDAGIIVLYYSLMYLYARAVISGEDRLQGRWFLHLLPCLLVYALMFPFLRHDQLGRSNELLQDLSPVTLLSLLLAIASAIGYLLAIFRLIGRHEINIKKTYSYDDNINLQWLKKLALLLAGNSLFLLIAVLYVYYLRFSSSESSIQLYSDLDFVGYSLFAVFIYLLGYFGYKQGNIFVHHPAPVGEGSGKPASQTVWKKSSTTPEERVSENQEKDFVRALYDFMEQEQPYLDSTLSLYHLAKQLSVSSHYLSHILNSRVRKNFYEFINHYRIDEVKRRIGSDQYSKYTILGIALDCGFNSKATFNRTFKNYTGYTPSQYQQEFGSNN
ncbi:MAG: helix-turn-helix domain-containing protein [Bacteroidota bacterium]